MIAPFTRTIAAAACRDVSWEDAVLELSAEPPQHAENSSAAGRRFVPHSRIWLIAGLVFFPLSTLPFSFF